MDEEDMKFLAYIQTYVSIKPSIAPHVTEHASKGLQIAFAELNQAKGDIESCLVGTLGKSWKGSAEMIKDKLRQNKKYLSFNWDWFTEPRSQSEAK